MMCKKIMTNILLLTLSLILAACDKGDSKKNAKQPTQQIITVKKADSTTSLFYTGTLNPISTISVFSPVDGRVHKMHFQYGEEVKKNQLLFSIDSKKLVDSYREALSDYLTKKATYINGIKEYQGNIALHNAGVISDSAFLNDKNTYDTNLLSFIQSRYALEKILSQAGVNPTQIEALSLTDTKELNKILQRHFDNIEVVAPGDGVALFPIGDSTSGGSSSDSASNSSAGVGTKLTEGTNVNQDQLLLSIGDLSGLSAVLDVNEIDINRIVAGLPAEITGDGFPGVTLEGKVTEVSSQSDPSAQSGDSGLSMFTVLISVPHITAADQKVVRVGMTAKVQIQIKNPPQMLIPINAVRVQNNVAQVQVMIAGKPVWQTVTTGATTMNSINILSGLKVGDQVVVPNE